jgi:hypothetical protein
VKHRTLLVLVAALSLAACTTEPEPPAGVISREKFVAANVAVRLLPDTAQQAARDATLKKAGVSDRQLRAWVTVYSREPETLAKTWEEIAFKVDSIGGGRPLPSGGGPTPPMAAGGPPPPIEMPMPDSLVLRRDDSLRYRTRNPPRLPRRRGDEGVSQQEVRVQ